MTSYCFSFKKKKRFVSFFVCLFRGYECLCLYAYVSHVSTEAKKVCLDPLELELQIVLSPLTWVLETLSSVGVSSAHSLSIALLSVL